MTSHQRPREVIDLGPAIGVPMGIDIGDGGGSVQVTVRDAYGPRSIIVSGSRVRVAPVLPTSTVTRSSQEPMRSARARRNPARDGRGAMVLVDLLLGLVVVLVVSVVVLNVTGVLATRVVLTGSMSPVINPGDVVVTLPVSTRTPSVGDIVTYTAQRFDGSEVAPVTHRIVAIDETGHFITKGDANPDPDVQHPTVDDVSGVVVAVVPKVGVVLQPLVLLGILVVLVAAWLAADWARRRP